MQLNEFHASIFAWLCVLSDRPPCSGGNLKRGGGCRYMHDDVGINRKKGATTKNQVNGLRGACLMIVCVVFLLDMTTPRWLRENVEVCYYVKNLEACTRLLMYRRTKKFR